ncbi:MGMT family protein [Propionibacteriaceae bacterium G1746]|uniref:MGMT family protein n=1 Tax=Aestuariimicrobium sp. G57 TaxID=3418485 RepID=UPI003C2A848B
MNPSRTDRSSRGGDAVVDRVLLAVEQLPPGRVVTYGDLAELVGTSARRVGRVMSQHGHEVCWWRVVNASGELPVDGARDHWQAEGIALAANGRACALRRHRADLVALARDYARAGGGAG